MQIILASAKIMNERTEVSTPDTSRPLFEKEAGEIALELGQMEVSALAKTLHCSNAIALENHRRYQSFFNPTEELPAILAYHGQAYKYLHAEDFSRSNFLKAQDHLIILSFLYGMLRPLDLIHPYRLEGKVKLEVTEGKTLFAWWKERLTDLLIRRVQADDGILLHLATEEFEHLFDWKRVKEEVQVIQPLFYVDKRDSFKIVSMYAKSCRGAMARYVIKNGIKNPDHLKGFFIDGFFYEPDKGDKHHLFFLKKER